MSKNKKIITIVLTIVLLLFLVGSIIFVIKKNSSNESLNKIDPSIISKLKNNHSGLSDDQLNFYASTAEKKTISPCEGRFDESDCISAVAFINSDVNFCHELGHKEDQKLYKYCASNILEEIASPKINQCDSLSGDDYFNCLSMIFYHVYQEQQDCVNLSDTLVKTVCEDFFNYQTVYSNYDRKLCESIKTEKLNQYCLKNIIAEDQDTDGDGLKDLEEINKYKTSEAFADSDDDGLNDYDEIFKYKTDPLNPDTDGDGHKDGEEVKNGFNPNGPGKLILKK